jgi:magnesium transporter
VKATLISAQGHLAEDPTPDQIHRAIVGEGFAWVDVDVGPDGSQGAELADLLTGVLQIHPLAARGATTFGQRPRVDEYDGFTYLVAQGPPQPDGPCEIHLWFAPGYVVSARARDLPALHQVRDRLTHHHLPPTDHPQVVLAYFIMDALADAFFPVLSSFDDQIDDLEEQILANPTEAQLGVLFGLKRQLVGIRKVVSPERDMCAALSSGIVEVPGATDETLRYFRDLYDHLIRINDLVDSYRDLVSGAMDTHVSMVSNRLNVVMKQLTIIATIFLPLSFLTGFFGQNFAYLALHLLVPHWVFWVFGVLLDLVVVVGMIIYFRRKGWIAADTTA